LLNKKVNQRICTFSKLKTANFLADFIWEDLLDLKIKPPYIPECEDYTKYLTTNLNPFENFLKVIYYNYIIFIIKNQNLIYIRMKKLKINTSLLLMKKNLLILTKIGLMSFNKFFIFIFCFFI
jgi:hypothetical protein